MTKQMTNQMPVTADRTYKDRLFRALFADKEHLLELYNALSGSDYQNPDDLEINTLDNAVYLGMKNDLSFLIDEEMNLYEHQTTVNPNKPLRGLLYLTDLLRGYLEKNGKRLYGSARIQVPAPHYVVFYNGAEDQPEREVVKLSDSYTVQDGGEPPCLEMSATILNVNLGYNRELMKRCQTLYEYAQLVSAVRKHWERDKDLTRALDQAIEECIRNNILAEFLRKNRAEVVDMLLYEYDEEEFIASEKELSFAEGEAKGKIEARRESILENLEDLGEVPDVLRNTILEQGDLDTLKRWNKLASKAVSIEAFEKQMNEA